MHIQEELFKRAGLSYEILAHAKEDPVFKAILSALESIHEGKGVLYGDYIETHGNEPKNFALIQHFCDMKRKYVRAENYVKKQSEGADIDIRELLDTYSDMAVYSILGIQLIYHLMEKEEQ